VWRTRGHGVARRGDRIVLGGASRRRRTALVARLGLGRGTVEVTAGECLSDLAPEPLAGDPPIGGIALVPDGALGPDALLEVLEVLGHSGPPGVVT
jgi:hypothetical protein